MRTFWALICLRILCIVFIILPLGECVPSPKYGHLTGKDQAIISTFLITPSESIPVQTGLISNPHFRLSNPEVARERLKPRTPPIQPPLPSGGSIIILGNGWLMRFIYSECGIPARIAAELLKDFYLKLLDRTEVYANEGDAMRSISLRIHDLHLDFNSDWPVITWDFIRTFIARMLYATDRGFTGRFLANLHHGPTDALIKVGLRVINSQELSEGTGSNYD